MPGNPPLLVQVTDTSLIFFKVCSSSWKCLPGIIQISCSVIRNQNHVTLSCILANWMMQHMQVKEKHTSPPGLKQPEGWHTGNLGSGQPDSQIQRVTKSISGQVCESISFLGVGILLQGHFPKWYLVIVVELLVSTLNYLVLPTLPPNNFNSVTPNKIICIYFNFTSFSIIVMMNTQRKLYNSWWQDNKISLYCRYREVH